MFRIVFKEMDSRKWETLTNKKGTPIEFEDFADTKEVLDMARKTHDWKFSEIADESNNRYDDEGKIIGFTLSPVTTHEGRNCICLTAEDILGLLKETIKFPSDTEVFFHVPGGGDWSNEDVTIDREHPLRICW